MKHPAESYLRDFAWGCQDITMRLLIETHLHFCSECSNKINLLRRQMSEPELPQVPEGSTAGIDFDKVMGSINEKLDEKSNLNSKLTIPNGILPDFLWAEISNQDQWKWTTMWPSNGKIGTVLSDKITGYSLHLGYFASGVQTPGHKHLDDEFTVMLKGGYSYGGKDINVGDWDVAYQETEHSPHIHSNEDCWCLVRAKTSGAIDFTGISAWRKPFILGMNIAEKYFN